MKKYGFEDRSEDSSLDPIQYQPLEVRVYNNFDRAVKAFKSLVQKERTLSIYKERQRYEKPSDRKRRKKSEAIQRRLESEFKAKRIASGEFDKERERKNAEKIAKTQSRATDEIYS